MLRMLPNDVIVLNANGRVNEEATETYATWNKLIFS